MKEVLLGKTLEGLKEVVTQLGLPGFTSKQLAQWIYQKRVNSFEEMHNLSKKARALLSEKYEVGFNEPVSVQSSTDGTKKYLYKNHSGRFIEAAYIPDENRNTLCVSSQVGCKMGCEFCMTGRQKFHDQLSAAEIINQLLSLPEYEKVSNIVYMGMGEPMDNIDEVLSSLQILCDDWGLGWSPKRITVSTVGVVPAMRRFLNESKCHLAISLHSPFDQERKEIMPVQNKYPIQEVIDELHKHDWKGQRRLSFEYIVFDGLNHSASHVKEISRLLHGLRYRMNLIRFHAIPDTALSTTNESNLELFKYQLEQKNITTTIRTSRGQDIDAACGLLSTKEQMAKLKEAKA
jgi:23S rRNA (adenine2503-C2)-methyltransferase